MTHPYSTSRLTGRPSTVRRVLAWSIDFALVLIGAYLLGVFAAQRIAEAFTDLPDLTMPGGWDLLTLDDKALDPLQQYGRELWDRTAVIVIQSFAFLAAGTFLYHWVLLTFGGRTLGKRLLGLRVTPHRAGPAALRAAVTTLTDVACFSLACCLLTAGAFLASFAVWLLAVAAFWFNALSALSPSGRSLADRLAGTCVIRGQTPPDESFAGGHTAYAAGAFGAAGARTTPPHRVPAG
ncbi:RDD family protein [Streptomyces sp. NPDC020802]|uniref:RDD family protein n=1 Tax=Streptomyces sp. NPDC020802 TaxID=3365094 RepID=UPI003788AC06